MATKGSKIFDEADPLADLLLSDEDSLGSRKEMSQTNVASPKETSLSAVGVDPTKPGAFKRDRSQVISEPYGLGSEDAKEETPAGNAGKVDGNHPELSIAHASDWLGIKSPVKTSPVKAGQIETLQSIVSINTSVLNSPKKAGDRKIDHDEDHLERIGFSNRKLSKMLDSVAGKVGATSKPKSIMDDLFGSIVTSTNIDKLASSQVYLDKKDDIKDVSQVSNPLSFGSYAPSVSTAREPRRSALRHTSNVTNPLGIFIPSAQVSSQDHAGEGSIDTPVPSARYDSATLQRVSSGDGAKPDPQTQVAAAETSRPWTPSSGPGGAMHVRGPASPRHHHGNPATSSAKLPEWLGGGVTLAKEESAMATVHQQVSEALGDPQHPELGDGVGGALLVGARMDQEVVAALQRQETQLVAALQVQQRQGQLAELHRRQQELLQRQEAQLSELVMRQVERQRQLESQLASQQERIATHIQALLSQPVVLPTPEQSAVGPTAEASVQSSQPTFAGVVQPSATEVSYRGELERLEDSYKRQIALLESSLERVEARLCAENARLETEYQARITKLQEELLSVEEAHKQKVAALHQERLVDLQHLKKLYQHEVDDLREHYVRVAALEQDNSLQTRSLQLLGESSARLASLEERADDRQRSELDERSAALRAREAELKTAREAMERQRLASEEERARLVGLVTELELRVAEQRGELESRAWELRQEAAVLEARTRALEGERQRSLARLQHERQQLQQLKQSVLEEKKRVSQQLREEQLKLSAEKSRLEAIARLRSPVTPAPAVDVEQIQAEAEATMLVARDAARQAEVEREKLAEQRRLLAAEQRRLREVESELAIRSQELDVLGEVSAATKEEGLRMLRESWELQQQQATCAAAHQTQLSQLQERERKLAEEKMAWSQERRALQASMQQERFCFLCRSLLEHPRPLAPPTYQPAHKHFVDPEQVILRLAGERDQDASRSNLVASLVSK
ncbi:trichohyalin isoform X2 [Bacillus rossius redtenbacheri]|uniref:trichohyalin isoform X2 n=1 Tax=Bacillus rossius redtenbacheri TaxID=93214 RepID=UPI002FDD8B46